METRVDAGADELRLSVGRRVARVARAVRGEHAVREQRGRRHATAAHVDTGRAARRRDGRGGRGVHVWDGERAARLLKLGPRGRALRERVARLTARRGPRARHAVAQHLEARWRVRRREQTLWPARFGRK